LQEAGYVRLSPDDFRLALHGRAHYGPAEQLVWASVDMAARALLIGGHAVVVDATNITRRRRAGWLRLARELGVPAEAFVVATSLEECLRRNRLADRPVPPEVMDRMAEAWEPVQAELEGLVVRILNG
jgi:predicted kinase